MGGVLPRKYLLRAILAWGGLLPPSPTPFTFILLNILLLLSIIIVVVVAIALLRFDAVLIVYSAHRGSGCDARPQYTCRDAYCMYSVCILSSPHACQRLRVPLEYSSTLGVRVEYVCTPAALIEYT